MTFLDAVSIIITDSLFVDNSNEVLYMKRNNYEHMKNQMRTHFLDYDQTKMIRKFSLKSDEAFLYIRFLGRNYRISRSHGTVEWSSYLYGRRL